MRLDDGEVLELDIQPDKKILGVWFFTKTIPYLMVIIFFVMMAVFFIDAFNLSVEASSNSATEVVQQTVIDAGVSQEKTGANVTTVTNIDKPHPFSYFKQYWLLWLVLTVVSLVLVQVYLIFLRKTYRYIVTNRRCIFVGGIVKRIERTVPYKKITDIQRSQNILERMLGIWNVQVFTPGTASIQMGQSKVRAELNFDGLLNSEDVYETINKYAQRSS